MKFRPHVLLAVACAAMPLAACATYPSGGAVPASAPPPVAPAGIAPAHSDTIVARIGGDAITLADLDRKVGAQLRLLERQRVEREYKIRQSGLDDLINQRLLAAEARRLGLTEGALLKAEVDDKTPAMTEGDLKAFYDAHVQQMPGPYAEIQDRLRQYMQNQRRDQRFQEYVASLRTASHVEISLPPPALARVEVAAIGPARGPVGAPVTIVVFSDFQCPFCAQANPTIQQVLETYGDRVQLVFRDFPLAIHPLAEKAAEAGHCAEEQGKFWEMHDRLFANQDHLDVADLNGHARQIGLDGAKFDACLDSGRMADRVQANLEAGEKAGVDGTPAFFINGVVLTGAQPFGEFKRLIDAELARPHG